ncbi:MAG: hypothetical protein ACLP3B_18840, partial [Syntrophobacteraceae bacterium]
RVKFGAMNKKLGLIFLVCFSISILGCSFHHHDDGESHDDCSICFCVAHHSNLGFQDFPQISPPVSDIFFSVLENAVYVSCPCCSPYSNRAPPA